MGMNKNNTKSKGNGKSKGKRMSMILDMNRVYDDVKDDKINGILMMGGCLKMYEHIFNGLKGNNKGFPLATNVFDGDDYPTAFILKSHLIQRFEEKLGIRVRKEELDQVENDLMIAIDPEFPGGRYCMDGVHSTCSSCK